MKSRPYVNDEGAGSASRASSLSSLLHLPGLDSHNQLAVSCLPAVAIASRDVAVAYALQLDLAKPHSSPVIETAAISGVSAAVWHVSVVWNCALLRGSRSHELR